MSCAARHAKTSSVGAAQKKRPHASSEKPPSRNPTLLTATVAIAMYLPPHQHPPSGERETHRL